MAKVEPISIMALLDQVEKTEAKKKIEELELIIKLDKIQKEKAK